MLTLESLNAGVRNAKAAAALPHEHEAAKTSSLPTSLRSAVCPACGFRVSAPFYDGGRQPLAMIAWPASSAEARTMPRYPLDFVRCLDCGHIFNSVFQYANVPYATKPNLMFNRGASWSGFLSQLREKTLSKLTEGATVVEIGHGDGHFLAGLAEAHPNGRYIGFDPHGAQSKDIQALELRAALFDPFRHIPELMPDLIVSRHVLEHLIDPLSLLQGINLATNVINKQVNLLFEVPCVDRAISFQRLGDFYYEHYSHFTTQSFQRMLSRSELELAELGHGYDGEVVYAFLNTLPHADQLLRLNSTLSFFEHAQKAPVYVAEQLQRLHLERRRVAIWGGVGKCAAFLNAFGIDSVRFPIVVDSDRGKAGTFVPGTGQEIRHCSYLLEHPVDVIIIPAQWRAKDIASEIDSMGLTCQLLIEHKGSLVDFRSGEHPYSNSRK